MNPFVSIITPVYNRPEKIIRSVKSVIESFKFDLPKIEIIVVDDNSSDHTLSAVRSSFKAEIESGLIHIITSEINRGVSGARNLGIKSAKGSWLLFVDSDDLLIQTAGIQLLDELEKRAGNPVIFFRCVDQDSKFVGTNRSEFGQDISLRLYLKVGSYGEALVAIQTECARNNPFVEELKGYEGLTIARIISAKGDAWLSSIIARVYDQSGQDRLSSRHAFFCRMPLLAKGHFLMATGFRQEIGIIKTLSYLIKAFLYLVLGYGYRKIKKIS